MNSVQNYNGQIIYFYRLKGKHCKNCFSDIYLLLWNEDPVWDKQGYKNGGRTTPECSNEISTKPWKSVKCYVLKYAWKIWIMWLLYAHIPTKDLHVQLCPVLPISGVSVKGKGLLTVCILKYLLYMYNYYQVTIQGILVLRRGLGL